MKALTILCIAMLLFLPACEGWPAGPYSYNPATPVPSRTPHIETATPRILTVTPITTITETAATSTATAETATNTPVTPTEVTPTQTAPSETALPATTEAATSLQVKVLGCDTSIDLLHGMGEVTNAYVTVSNATSSDAADVCSTLRGLDEGRAHPDKTKCMPIIPAGYQVTLKLTVDTTYKAETPIQVDVTSGETFVSRAGEAACTAIGLLLPQPDQLGVLTPIP